MIRRWPTALGVNLLLGVPGVVPIWLLWFLAANWSHPEPTENDGMALWLVIILPIVGLYTLLWWTANRALARRTSLAARTYWLLSAMGTFSPTVTLVLIHP
ncbi:hypothetical protein [Streptomyces sp. 142MFCol3.1]|uniref:hypothetical protein n=1 Tax=Streptomyces sp. 142MFCol3.1 TaxID=1172179 RepID=UPI00048FDB87|nr:hypothetical protein [Streptomyces sp. 142MFCol3.1]